MKKLLLLLALMAAIATSVSAQRVVALHSATGVSVFSGLNPFVDAYNAAMPGDTIYLSGGSFANPSLMDKRLHIYGAGYHPTGAAVTNPTLLTGAFTLGDNADNLMIQGVQFMAGIHAGNNVPVTFISVKRSRIDGGINFPGTRATPSTNNAFVECVIIGDVNFNNVTNSSIVNSIVQNQIANSHSNAFMNNILLGASWSGTWGNIIFSNPFHNQISNNIVLTPANMAAVTSDGNQFFNNLFETNAPHLGNSPTATGNFLNVPVANIFVSHTGSTFSYASDFNLQTPSARLGNDGTQVGIFGGLFPFKPGGIPQNPHISVRNIAPHTAPDGKLNIQVTVSAQER
jgi:hypothetical protein